jgi:hypothetical protein
MDAISPETPGAATTMALEAWRAETTARDRAFVLSPEFVRLFPLAHHEGLLPALLRAADLDLPDEIPPPESKLWLPRVRPRQQ